MKSIPEVVIYKKYTLEDAIQILELAHSGRGFIRLSDGTMVTKIVRENMVELEIIERNYQVDE